MDLGWGMWGVGVEWGGGGTKPHIDKGSIYYLIVSGFVRSLFSSRTVDRYTASPVLL